MKTYIAVEAVVMRLIQEGKITCDDAGELLKCSSKTIAKMKKDSGVSVVFKGTGQNRKDAAEANKQRNELLETLAKRVKYEKEDIKKLSEEYFVPVRTLYRWVLRVPSKVDDNEA